MKIDYVEGSCGVPIPLYITSLLSYGTPTLSISRGNFISIANVFGLLHFRLNALRYYENFYEDAISKVVDVILCSLGTNHFPCNSYI